MSAVVTQLTCRGEHAVAVAKRGENWGHLEGGHWTAFVSVGSGDWSWGFNRQLEGEVEEVGREIEALVARGDAAWARVLQAQAVRDASMLPREGDGG